jgi:transposase
MGLLGKLEAGYAGKPIRIILDNARYQHCAVVMARAVELNIELIFLPTYPPNLNLIERAWKFVKANVLNAAYIETFDEYCERISSFVDCIEIENAERLSSLITDNFQSFDKLKVA